MDQAREHLLLWEHMRNVTEIAKINILMQSTKDKPLYCHYFDGWCRPSAWQETSLCACFSGILYSRLTEGTRPTITATLTQKEKQLSGGTPLCLLPGGTHNVTNCHKLFATPTSCHHGLKVIMDPSFWSHFCHSNEVINYLWVFKLNH